MTSEGLPRNWRITRGDDIRTVLTAKTRRRTSMLDFAWRPNEAGHPRLGVVVPRFGHTAVARNRLRRRLREGARRHLLPQLPPMDLVIRPRAAAYDAAPAALIAELESWLRHLPQ